MMVLSVVASAVQKGYLAPVVDVAEVAVVGPLQMGTDEQESIAFVADDTVGDVVTVVLY